MRNISTMHKVLPLTPLCFTANTAWSTVTLNNNSSSSVVVLETSTDWTNRNTYTFNTQITLTNQWDFVMFRNTSTTTTRSGNACYFTMTGSISASWDVCYLLNKFSTKVLVWERTFTNLFRNCTSLTTPPSLPATTLTNYCYSYMFAWCSYLTIAPELPATTLTEGCYSDMFYNCISLTNPPELPSTTLALGCYYEMFKSCLLLATAPNLPATTLTQRCYASMFEWCTALKVPPVLSATTLIDYCYYRMFFNCTNLLKINKLPALTLAAYSYSQMYQGCSKIKLSTTQNWTYWNAYRIPLNWTWTDSNSWYSWMFLSTWWTMTNSISINTTYYTSNTLV